MEKSSAKYSKSISTGVWPMETVRKEYELQYNEDHIVEKVEVGETDLIKEVQSHKDEVGLINVVKNAIAHGEDPLTKFNKVGAGVPVSVDPNATFDELKEMMDADDKKYADIASSLGLSVDQLKAAIADGSIGQVIKASAASQVEEKKEGEE